METHHDIPTITCFPSSFHSIDTIRSEDISDSRGVVYLQNADGSIPPADLETKVKISWNQSFLFVIFQGRFSELRYASSHSYETKDGKTFLLWEQSDVYEVFVGTDVRKRRTYSEFQVGPDARRLDILVVKQQETVKADFNWTSGFRCSSMIQQAAKTWDSVFEIPWKALGANYDSHSEWNINFYRASGRFHGDELLAWSPVGTGEKAFHRPEKFGKIIFQH